MIYKPYPYQDHATQHILKNPFSGLFMEMGLGKTVSTLTAIDLLQNDYFEISKTLVIAPKRVAEEVWSAEIEKWDHLKHLTVSKVLGPEIKRKIALKQKADLYIINRENIPWLITYLQGHWPFDLTIIDELSSFKSAKAIRFKALRKMRPKMKRVIGLTGTPAPNGLLDLWPQIYLLDEGERLGKHITHFRDRYFTPGKRNGDIVYQYNLRKDDPILGDDYYQKEIFEKIGDICISMKAEDYLQLPPVIERNIEITLPPIIQKQYEDFERKLVLSLEDVDISPINAAALSNKLLQFANGAVYDSSKKWHEVHNKKLEALEEIIDVANGKPVLVCYSFIHDMERIMKFLKKYKPVLLNGPGISEKWNRGEIQVLLGHPASMGHGLNLQAGGNIFTWFGRPWNLEHFQQAPKRIHRQGLIAENMIMNSIIAKNTIDVDVVRSNERKAGVQDGLMTAVKAIISKHRKLKIAV